MKKIALATTVLVSMAVSAPTLSFAEGSADRYTMEIDGVEYHNCNDRKLKGDIVSAEDKPNARKRARNKARTELLQKLKVNGGIEGRDRILADTGRVKVRERKAEDGQFAYNAIMFITLCDKPE